MSSFKTPNAPSTCIDRFIRNRTPTSDVIRASASTRWRKNVLDTYKRFTRSSMGCLPLDFMDLYLTLHEADITKLYAVAEGICARKTPQTNLRRFRELAGLSQSELSAEADVSLRSIQMYEQRNKSINKAQAITVIKIARVLGCEALDLIENVK